MEKFIRIPEHRLFLTGFALLYLPILLFLSGMLQVTIALPLLLLSGYGFWKLNFFLEREFRSELKLDRKLLWTVIAAMALWSFLSGIGGFFPQKMDNHWRNAFLYDLIHAEWPVSFVSLLQGKLVYYFAYWLPPALIGKLFAFRSGPAGTLAGHLALLGWTVINLSVIALILLSGLKKICFRTVLILIAVLIFFSGMDYPGNLFRYRAFWGDHIERWAWIFQYSSNTTQLEWVYNQAVPAWLCTALFWRIKRVGVLGILAGAILPFAPFPAIGFAGLLMAFTVSAGIQAYRKSVLRSFLTELFSAQNLALFAASAPVFILFYLSHSGFSVSGGEPAVPGTVSFSRHVPFKLDSPDNVILYVAFILLEFLLLWLVIFKPQERLLRWTVLAELLVIPVYQFFSYDFCLRACIPALFLLMILVIEFLTEEPENWKKRVLTGFLLIGTLTPAVEFADSFRRLKTPPYRLDEIGSFADLLPPPLLAENLSDNLGHFFATQPEKTVFFRYLAKKEVFPADTPENQLLFEFLKNARERMPFSSQLGCHIGLWHRWLLVIPAEPLRPGQEFRLEFEDAGGRVCPRLGTELKLTGERFPGQIAAFYVPDVTEPGTITLKLCTEDGTPLKEQCLVRPELWQFAPEKYLR